MNHPDTLKYIAVDELHTFDGAQGTDLACLLRRLKSRLRTPGGYLCCIGSSATMGSKDNGNSILQYAEEIFGEPFEEDSHARTGKPDSLRPFLNVQVQLWMRELRRLVARVSGSEITYSIAHDLNTQQAKQYLPVVNCRDCGATGWTSILNERGNATAYALSILEPAKATNSLAFVDWNDTIGNANNQVHLRRIHLSSRAHSLGHGCREALIRTFMPMPGYWQRA